MFTGIVTHLGVVESIVDGSGRTLEIVPLAPMEGLTVGASVAHSGICLTLVELTERGWRVDASAETLARTTLGGWQRGERINLERSLRLGDELGGHLVFGHVDGVAEILAIEDQPGGHRMVFSLPPNLAPLVAVKGSIAVDGVSLTVTEVASDRFATVIVPHTWSVTTLHERRPGDRVNLEADMLARYVARQLAHHGFGALRD
jgi:riboflavin synthase